MFGVFAVLDTPRPCSCRAADAEMPADPVPAMPSPPSTICAEAPRVAGDCATAFTASTPSVTESDAVRAGFAAVVPALLSASASKVVDATALTGAVAADDAVMAPSAVDAVALAGADAAAAD